MGPIVWLNKFLKMHFSTHLSFFPPPASHIDCKGGNKRYDKNKPFYIKTHYFTHFSQQITKNYVFLYLQNLIFTLFNSPF